MSIRLPLVLSVTAFLCLLSSVASAVENPPRVPARGEPDESDRPAPNSIFLEGLGSGVLYSINYERRVIDDLGLRIGLGHVQFGSPGGGTGGLGIN